MACFLILAVFYYSVILCVTQQRLPLYSKPSGQTKILKYLRNSLEQNRDTAVNILSMKGLVKEVNSLILPKIEGSCTAIIYDSANQEYFSENLVGHLGTSYLKVLVGKMEDLLSPNYNTLKVIEEIFVNGCSFYVIFISNVSQTLRFLKFCERYRMLNTRAYFLLLHNKELLNSQLHSIWKKVFNVIFISFHEENLQYDKSQHMWYELTSVSFPYYFRENMSSILVNIWKNSHFRYPTQLYPEKSSHLHGKTIRVAMFQHLPGSTKLLSSFQNGGFTQGKEIGYFGGLEIQVIKAIAKSMDFDLDIYETPNAEKEMLGTKLPNGSWNGLVGQLVNDDADIILGNLHYTLYLLDYLDLTIPYMTQCLTFLTPESMTDNSWKTLILPFKPYLWTGASITLVLAAISFYILARIHKVIIFEIAGKTNSMCNTEGKTDILNEKKRHSIIPYEENYLFENLENVLLNTYSMLFLVSLSKLPKAWPLRVLTGWWCLYCLLITVAYKASMTAILTRPAVRITIDTLDQLASSSVSCGGWDSQSIDFFLMSLDTAGQEIGRKFEVINDINDGIKRTSQGQFAYYDNIYFLKHVIREQMDTRNQSETNQSNINSYRNNKIINSTNLHVMQECVVNMPVALGLQKNSPLKSTIDNVLLRIVESGLVKQWLHDVLVTTEHPENLFPEKGFMDLPKIYVALIALAIGYITSCCILIVENIGWHYFVKSNPLFDKYNKY